MQKNSTQMSSRLGLAAMLGALSFGMAPSGGVPAIRYARGRRGSSGTTMTASNAKKAVKRDIRRKMARKSRKINRMKAKGRI
jgi:hypothetical protein